MVVLEVMLLVVVEVGVEVLQVGEGLEGLFGLIHQQSQLVQ